MNRAWPAMLVVSTLALCLTPDARAIAAPADDGRAVIGIVRDGAQGRLEGSFSPIGRYLRELAGDGYDVVLADRFKGDQTVSGVRAALLRALRDPEVEVVFAGGLIATELALALAPEERTKPIFGGFPQMADRGRGTVGPDGRSTISRYTFVATPARVAADLTMLRSLTGATAVHALLDEGLFAVHPDWPQQLAEMERRTGGAVRIHAARGPIPKIIDSLPEDTQAVYVSILPRLSRERLKALFEGLAERKIFSLAMERSMLDLGATAVLGSDLSDPLSRRAAVNIHQLCLGTPTESLAVYLPSEDQLVINAEIADRIGWSADYDTYLSAQFVNEDRVERGAPLSLDDAMDRAARWNADARASRSAADVSRATVGITRSALLPRADLRGQHSGFRFSDRIDPTSPSATHGGRYGVQIQQVLFDDGIWSDFRAQRRVARSAELDALSAELDARSAGGAAFLGFVLESLLSEIQRENLLLTESNLRLARLRVDIGAAEASEVFRWESQVARARADLIARQANRDNARYQLNRILGEPRDKRWDPEEIELGDEEFYFLDRELDPLIHNQADFAQLAGYMQVLSVANSPELASFDQQLEAQGILLGQRRRAYFVPSLQLQGGYDRVIQGGRGIPTRGENEWSVGASISLPLFEGGRRKAAISQQRALISQLESQREAAVQRLEEQARTTASTLGADHANIRLSRRARDSAQKNYESVSEKYAQGAATILELLDAQSRLLGEKQQAAVALYSYLSGVVTLQRSIAWFESTKTEEEKRRWAQDFGRFLAGELPGEEP